MRVNGQDFNQDWAKEVSEEHFIKTLLPANFWIGKDKEARLREAWRVLNGKPPKKQKAEDAE